MTTIRDRENHIKYMWAYGHRGSVDASKKARTVLPFGSLNPGQRYPRISPVVDLEGLDLPVEDIKVFKGKSGKNVYVGGPTETRRTRLSSAVRDVMQESFTSAELRRMKLYFEASHPKSKGAAGECESFTFPNGTKASIIRAAKGYEREDVLVHEMVHARRFAANENIRDIDREESKTELEAVIRMSNPIMKEAGYYSYLPGGNSTTARIDMMMHDRIRATGSAMKNLKGTRAVRRANEVYPHSWIGQLCIGGGSKTRKRCAITSKKAEDIDRYFLVMLPTGVKINIHIRYKTHQPITQIKKDMKKKYGSNIKVWEWRDGRKYPIIKPSKTKTRKTHTKKQKQKKLRTKKNR